MIHHHGNREVLAHENLNTDVAMAAFSSGSHPMDGFLVHSTWKIRLFRARREIRRGSRCGISVLIHLSFTSTQHPTAYGSSIMMVSYPLINLVTYVVNLAVTYGLGNLNWFGLPDNAAISHKYQTIITPAEWAFAVRRTVPT